MTRMRTKICLCLSALLPLGLIGEFLGRAYQSRRIDEAFSGGRPYTTTILWPWYVGLAKDVVLIGIFSLALAIAFLALDRRSKSQEAK